MDATRSTFRFLVLWALGLLALLALVRVAEHRTATERASRLTALVADVRSGAVSRLEIGAGRIIATPRPTGTGSTRLPTVILTSLVPGLEEEALLQEARKAGVAVIGQTHDASAADNFLSWALPIIIVGGLAFALARWRR